MAVNYDKNLDLKTFQPLHDFVVGSVMSNQVGLLILRCMVDHRNLNYLHRKHHYRQDLAVMNLEIRLYLVFVNVLFLLKKRQKWKNNFLPKFKLGCIFCLTSRK